MENPPALISKKSHKVVSIEESQRPLEGMKQRRNHPLVVSRKKERKGNSLKKFLLPLEVALDNHLKKLKHSVSENRTKQNKQIPEVVNTGEGARVQEVSNNLKT